MRGLTLTVLACIVSSAYLAAQGMAPHAAAATGASLGVIAGKPVSRSLDKLSSVAGKAAAKPKPAAAKPAEKKPDRPNEKRNAQYEIPGGFGVASKPVPIRHPVANSASMHPRPPVRPQLAPVLTATPVPPQPRRVYLPVDPDPPTRILAPVDVAWVQVGTGRSEILATLGPPASLLSMPEEGHLLETFRYYAGAHWVATLRLDNGQVVSIEKAE